MSHFDIKSEKCELYIQLLESDASGVVVETLEHYTEHDSIQT